MLVVAEHVTASSAELIGSASPYLHVEIHRGPILQHEEGVALGGVFLIVLLGDCKALFDSGARN